MYQPQRQINYRGGGPRINHTTRKKWLFYPYTNYSTITSTKKLPLCSIPSLPSKFTKCLVYRLQFSNKPERQVPFMCGQYFIHVILHKKRMEVNVESGEIHGGFYSAASLNISLSTVFSPQLL